MTAELIDLDKISTEGTQTRATLREQAIVEYAELIEDGVGMEPATVFRDGDVNHLAAGHHRRVAYKRAGKTQMPCVVKQGTKWDAIQYGIRDNLKHAGERVTNADKAHNIRLALKEQPKWGNEKIAELCGATAKTVARYRRSMQSTLEIPESTSRIGRDGRVCDTTNLGRKPSAQPRDLQPSSGGEGQAASEPDAEHCKCGGRWVSDGEGGRFCEKCRAAHPKDARSCPDEEDDFLTLVEPKVTIEPTKSLEHLFEEAYRRLGRLKSILDDISHLRPGPCYEQAMVVANKLGKWLDYWKKEAD